MSTFTTTRRFSLLGTLAVSAVALATLTVPLAPAKAQYLGFGVGPFGYGFGAPYSYYYNNPPAYYYPAPRYTYNYYSRSYYPSYYYPYYSGYYPSYYTGYYYPRYW
jgi:hypothetical protein